MVLRSIAIRGGLRQLSPAQGGPWQEEVNRLGGDFYHSATYHRLSEERGEGQARLAIYEEGERRLIWPYLLREIEGPGAAGYRDVTSVYGYAGPLADESGREEGFLQRAYEALNELWRSEGVVSVFARLHPVLGNEALSPAARPATGSGWTVSIDLSRGKAASAEGYSRTLRYHLNRARRSGLRTFWDERWEHLAAFVALYHETMRRNGATACYYFDRDYFAGLARYIGPRCRLVVALSEDRVVAGCVVVEWNGLVAYHLGATANDYLPLSPLKLLLDEVRRWAAEKGCRVLHLGGGRGAQTDGLFRFKAAFSQRRHRFFVWRSVIQPAIYEQLCGVRRQRRAPFMNGEDNGHFPAYRQPDGRPRTNERSLVW